MGRYSLFLYLCRFEVFCLQVGYVMTWSTLDAADVANNYLQGTAKIGSRKKYPREKETWWKKDWPKNSIGTTKLKLLRYGSYSVLRWTIMCMAFGPSISTFHWTICQLTSPWQGYLSNVTGGYYLSCSGRARLNHRVQSTSDCSLRAITAMHGALVPWKEYVLCLWQNRERERELPDQRRWRIKWPATDIAYCQQRPLKLRHVQDESETGKKIRGHAGLKWRPVATSPDEHESKKETGSSQEKRGMVGKLWACTPESGSRSTRDPSILKGHDVRPLRTESVMEMSGYEICRPPSYSIQQRVRIAVRAFA